MGWNHPHRSRLHEHLSQPCDIPSLRLTSLNCTSPPPLRHLPASPVIVQTLTFLKAPPEASSFLIIFQLLPFPLTHHLLPNSEPYLCVLNTFNACSALALANPPTPLSPLRSQPLSCGLQILHPVTNCNRCPLFVHIGRGGLSKGKVRLSWSESQASG